MGSSAGAGEGDRDTANSPVWGWRRTSGASRMSASPTMVTAAADVGTEIPGVSLMGLKYRLGDLGVTIVPSSTVSAVDGRTVEVTNLLSGHVETLSDIDTVIHAGPYQRENALAAALSDRVSVVAVGDALAPRRMLEAMREGHDAGLAL